MSLFLFLIIAAVVLGLIGAVAGGLGFLLAIGIALFAADLGYGYWRVRHRPHLVR
jgi:hypothetical protein